MRRAVSPPVLPSNMNRTLNTETEQNVKRLRRTLFCAACNTDRDTATEQIHIGNERWLCSDCDGTTVGDFLKGDRR